MPPTGPWVLLASRMVRHNPSTPSRAASILLFLQSLGCGAAESAGIPVAGIGHVH